MKSKDEFENIEIKLQIEDESDNEPRNIFFEENKLDTLIISEDRVYSEKTDEDKYLNIEDPMKGEDTNLKSKKKMKLKFSIVKDDKSK